MSDSSAAGEALRPHPGRAELTAPPAAQSWVGVPGTAASLLRVLAPTLIPRLAKRPIALDRYGGLDDAPPPTRAGNR